LAKYHYFTPILLFRRLVLRI